MAERLTTLPNKPLEIASCLIFDKKNRLLLLRRHTDDLGGGMWAAPGGKQEPDEDATLTALRETKEETGLKLENLKYAGKHKLIMPHGVVHIKTFIAQVINDQVITLNPEEHDLHKWFELSSLTTAENIIWGLPTTLMDFGLITSLDDDPTLTDGSQAILLERATSLNISLYSD